MKGQAKALEQTSHHLRQQAERTNSDAEKKLLLREAERAKEDYRKKTGRTVTPVRFLSEE